MSSQTASHAKTSGHPSRPAPGAEGEGSASHCLAPVTTGSNTRQGGDAKEHSPHSSHSALALLNALTPMETYAIHVRLTDTEGAPLTDALWDVTQLTMFLSQLAGVAFTEVVLLDSSRAVAFMGNRTLDLGLNEVQARRICTRLGGTGLEWDGIPVQLESAQIPLEDADHYAMQVEKAQQEREGKKLKTFQIPTRRPRPRTRTDPVSRR